MRYIILSALILASAFQTAFADTFGEWTYTVSNSQATITGYTGADVAVEIPSSLNGNSVTSIGPSAFVFRSALTSVTIPTSVTSIGSNAFFGCSALISIVIPSGVTIIGQGAFSSCSKLTSITIPNGVTSIGSSTFHSCSKLTSITIPNSVTSIGTYAFQFCTGLTSVTIPSSVTSIGASAFAGCTGLTSIVLPSTQTTVGASAIPSSTTILYSNQISSLAMDSTFGTALASNSAFVTALANNDAFVAAVANKIKGTMGNYGIATQGLLFNVTDTLATKSELTTGLTESRTAGVNSVLSNPNLWTLYTTSQIQNMAVGDLVLTKDVAGILTLNYDIEQSTDLVTWTTYQALSLPLSGLPTDKAFVRIKAKQ